MVALSSAPHAVVVPCHSLGSEVAVLVFSKAVWRYAMGVGGEVGEKGADSTSRDQKWRISLDQSLGCSINIMREEVLGKRRTLRVRAP